jgi:ribose transport system substrate-binding protein
MKLLITVFGIILFTSVIYFPRGTADGNKKHTAKTTAGGRLFVSSFMTMHDPFFVELNEGIKKAVEAHGDRLLFLDGEHSREQQEKGIIEALKQKPAAIFLLPATDLGSIDKILAESKRAHVPVIIVDTDVSAPDSLIVCSVLTDNIGAGRIACEELARVNPNAKIGVLHFSLSKVCVDRVKGFTDEMVKYPGMKILDTQEGHANKEGVRGVIKGFLSSHPDMDAIFAINDVSAIEAYAGIETAGRAGKITVLGVAGSYEGAKYIQDGKIHSSCAQRPMEIGRTAVQKAYDYIAGKKVEKDVRVPVKLITKANVDEFLKSDYQLNSKKQKHGEISMQNFQTLADNIINEMEIHARKLGVKGVIMVASMDDAGNSWVSKMKAVNAIKVLSDDPKSEYPGYNFIGIAYSKAAEMADTKLNSGSKVRAPYQGEFGYQGGLIKKMQSGFIITVFSGATSEQDLEIAQVGMNVAPE